MVLRATWAIVELNLHWILVPPHCADTLTLLSSLTSSSSCVRAQLVVVTVDHQIKHSESMHLTGYEGLLVDNVAAKVVSKLEKKSNQIFASETNANNIPLSLQHIL